MKRTGPRTDPCGTPQESVTGSDWTPLMWMVWVRLERYEENQESAVCVMPKVCWSLDNKMVWSMVSNHTSLLCSRNQPLFSAVFITGCSRSWRYNVRTKPQQHSQPNDHSCMLMVSLLRQSRRFPAHHEGCRDVAVVVLQLPREHAFNARYDYSRDNVEPASYIIKRFPDEGTCTTGRSCYCV